MGDSITADKEEEPLLAGKAGRYFEGYADWMRQKKDFWKMTALCFRDLFDTKIMSVLVARPSEIIRKFRECYAVSPEAATEYFTNSARIRIIYADTVSARIEMGNPDTLRRSGYHHQPSKPEKDPKAIGLQRTLNKRLSQMPACMENEGYAGRVNHPARQNHRIIPITINGGQWGFQYSPLCILQ